MSGSKVTEPKGVGGSKSHFSFHSPNFFIVESRRIPSFSTPLSFKGYKAVTKVANLLPNTATRYGQVVTYDSSAGLGSSMTLVQKRLPPIIKLLKTRL